MSGTLEDKEVSVEECELPFTLKKYKCSPVCVMYHKVENFSLENW